MADIRVQRGEANFGSSDTTADITLSSAVDMDHTFLRLSGIYHAGSGNFSDGTETTLVWAELLNTTTIRVHRATGGQTPGNALDVKVEAIEDTTGGTFWTVLGRGIVTGSTAAWTHDVSHTTASDINQVAVLNLGGGHDDHAAYGTWRGYRLTTSSSRFIRGTVAASEDYAFSWEVVEFASSFTVKEHNLSDSGAADTEVDHTVSTLTDLDKCALLYGGVETDGSRRFLDELYVTYHPTSVTNIKTITDESSWSSGVTITLYSLYHPDLAVERDWTGTGGGESDWGASETSRAITISTIALDSASVEVSGCSNDNGQANYSKLNLEGELTATTTLTVTRAGTEGGTNDFGWEVIDWSGLTTDQDRGGHGLLVLTGHASGTPTAADRHSAVVIEMAFDHFDKTTAPAAGDWTDVSADVFETSKVRITRGFDRAMTTANPGRCEWVMDNRDRDYERGYASSPYGTDVMKPGIPVRISVEYRPAGKYNARRYVRFYGFLKKAEPAYTHKGKLPIVRCTALDLQATLAKAPAPISTETELELGSPFAYFKLLETSGTVATDDGSGGNDGTYGGSYTLAHLSWSEETDRKHPQFDGGDADGVSATLTGITSTGPLTMLARIYVDGVDGANPLFDHTIAELGPTGSNNAMAMTFSIRPDGTLHYRHGALKMALSNPAVDTDLSALSTWYFVAITRSALAAEVKGYIAGVLTSVGTQDGTEEAIPSSDTIGIGLGQHSAAGSSSMGFEGVIGDLAIYEEELSAGRIAAIAASSSQDRPAEDAGTRVTAILNDLGIPAAWQSIEPGDSTLQAVTLDATAKSWALIIRAAQSDLGRAYVSRDGKVRFEGRWYRTHQESVVTLGDYTTNGERHLDDLKADWNDERLLNRARITRDGGEEQVHSKLASISSYGEFQTSRTVDVANDAEALTMAEVIAETYDEPDQVLPKASINPLRDGPNLYPVALEADVSTRLLVQYRPDGIQPGTPLAQDSFIEGLSEVIGEKDYRLDLRLSSADTQTFWVLGESKLGQTTRLGY